MQKVFIHPAGPQLSRIVAGVWRWHTVSSQQIDELVHRAIACGMTTFDHADIYGNYTGEEIFGKILQRHSGLRNQMELVTKCGIKLVSTNRPAHRIKHYDTSREHIIKSVENSLKNLATDRIDVLLLHRPDPLMSPQEVAEAFSTLHTEGKVLYFGVSNFTPSQFEMLQSYLPFPLVTNQIELSLFKNSSLFDGTLDILMKHRASPMAWSPLGAGKYFHDAMSETLQPLANHYNCTLTQVLLAWLLYHPAGIVPIVGTTKPERIEEASKATTINLEKQHWFEMLKLVSGKDVA